MYSDRVEAETVIRKTVKTRLNVDFSSRGRTVTRKRERQDDDKWEHDLFEDDDKPQLSNRRFDPKDLRLKLRKKQHNGLQNGGRGANLGVRDLREKLSGTMNSLQNSSNPLKSRTEAARPVTKKAAGDTKSETRTASNRATKKKLQQTNESVDSFLESLGLEKYSTLFQVEEIDMAALIHMTDDDLKDLLIPMGPRKKILLALGSRRSLPSASSLGVS